IDDTQYILAYIDQEGGYAMAERSGTAFLPGILGTQPLLGQGEHHLLIVALEERVLLYIDGTIVGEIEATPTAGSVGNAVVNYDQNTTVCDFENTWVWTWDAEAAAVSGG
ncbi:MAG: hypothetical protein AAF125_10425, partial [Chloroflexota bacterium]